MAKRKKNKKLILTAVLLIAVVLCGIIAVCNVPQIRLLLAGGGKVTDGLLPGVDSDAHITSVPDGEIRYLINKRIVFEDKYSLGSVIHIADR